jgi:hypothetical protein
MARKGESAMAWLWKDKKDSASQILLKFWFVLLGWCSWDYFLVAPTPLPSPPQLAP